MDLSVIWDSYKASSIIYDSHHPLTADALHLIAILEKMYGSSAYLVNSSGNKYVMLSKADIAGMLGLSVNNISKSTISDIAWQIRGICVCYGNASDDRWYRYEFISNAAYDRGYMVVAFSQTAEMLFGIDSYREKVRLSPSIHWKSRYSHILHDRLMFASVINNYAGLRTGDFLIEYSLDELRVIFNTTDIGGSRAEEYSYSDFNVFCSNMVSKSREIRYPQYAELYRNVLYPAVKELNENAASYFGITIKKRVSAHNRTDGIAFIVNVRCAVSDS